MKKEKHMGKEKNTEKCTEKEMYVKKESHVKKKVVDMVGNTHIDPVWLWNQAEGMQEVKSSFASALERMKEFPDFKFTHSSISYLEWVRDNCPDLFQEIREREAEGRWEVAGGMWVEPDCNIPSAESMIRHFLYSKKFTDEYFTRDPKTVYNVDSFGHGANLPAIYKQCDMDSCLVMRPDKTRLSCPPVFRWTAPNGDNVVTERTGGEYMAWTRPSIEVNLSESLEAMEKYSCDKMAVFYGVGNHGGGPTVDNIRSVHEMMEEYPELDMKFAAIRDFFEKTKTEELPVFKGELGRIFRGCYNSDNEIKRLNRKAEWSLLKTEAICSMAKEIAGDAYTYPLGKLEEAWKSTLFQQFHDILAGTSIEIARNEATEQFTSSIATARRLTADGVQAIANSLDTRGEGFPLVLVNPTGYEFEGITFADVYMPRALKKPLRMRDSKGKEIPYAQTQYHFHTPESRKGIIFPAKVPAYGYAVYRVIPEGSEKTEYESTMSVSGMTFGNGIVEFTLDETTGCPASIRVQGKELLKSPASVQVFYDDRGAWGTDTYEEVLEGSFQTESIEVIEKNFLRTIVRSCLTYGKSELVLDFILEKDAETIKINGEIHNFERHVMTTLTIPCVDDEVICHNETHFLKETKAAADGSEYYQHRFADLVNKDSSGIAVFNNTSYGMMQKKNEYRMVLLRSVMFARGEGGPAERSMKNHFMDQGYWEFQVELLPYVKEKNPVTLFQIADKMHMGIEYLGDSNHAGKLWLREGSCISIHGEGVAASCYKRKASDGKTQIFRFFETNGKETTATITQGKKTSSVKLPAYGIKTVAITQEGMEEVNMIERKIEASK